MRFEEELLYDTSTIDKLRHLEEAKREAVSELDFERAKLIKDAMDRLRVVG
jgi:excinuclease UvrABC nuclease subunit